VQNINAFVEPKAKRPQHRLGFQKPRPLFVGDAAFGRGDTVLRHVVG
jgi:hypothetical protein